MYIDIEHHQDRIKVINGELKRLSGYDPEDRTQDGLLSVAGKMNRLRELRKWHQEQVRIGKADRNHDWAKRRALRRIFDKHNDGIYPSDIGQYWRWREEDGEVICLIEDKEFREPILDEVHPGFK